MSRKMAGSSYELQTPASSEGAAMYNNGVKHEVAPVSDFGEVRKTFVPPASTASTVTSGIYLSSNTLPPDQGYLFGSGPPESTENIKDKVLALVSNGGKSWQGQATQMPFGRAGGVSITEVASSCLTSKPSVGAVSESEGQLLYDHANTLSSQERNEVIREGWTREEERRDWGNGGEVKYFCNCRDKCIFTTNSQDQVTHLLLSLHNSY